jgi:hypothetical protein
VNQVGDDETHHLGSTEGQPLGVKTGLIIQLFDSTQDTFAGGRTDIPVIVDHLRNSHHRNAKLVGYILHPNGHFVLSWHSP